MLKTVPKMQPTFNTWRRLSTFFQHSFNNLSTSRQSQLAQISGRLALYQARRGHFQGQLGAVFNSFNNPYYDDYMNHGQEELLRTQEIRCFVVLLYE